MLRCRHGARRSRWCEMRVRVDGRKGGPGQIRAFWIRRQETEMALYDDFLAGLHPDHVC